MRRSDYCTRADCLYHKKAKKNSNDHSCDYLVMTGRSRIAQIPDQAQRRNWAACPCYKSGQRSRAMRPTMEVNASRQRYDWALGTMLYRAGASDAEIARALGCSRSGVKWWRRRMGYPGNGGKEETPCDGATDAQS